MRFRFIQAATLILIAIAIAIGPARAAAQTDPSCTYDACAVRLDYTFFGGQHLVRGQVAERVATVSPWSSSVRAALAGNDSATVYAATFQTKYQWGSAMAVAGSVIGAATIFLAGDDWSDVDVAFTITSYGIALVGGWLITSGMRDLHRAIWWHNRQFGDTSVGGTPE